MSDWKRNLAVIKRIITTVNFKANAHGGLKLPNSGR